MAPESRRIRALPNERTLRYYITLGILAKPAGFRGRTANFGLDHLTQVVAIKRLQAEGLGLAEIRIRLAGATPEEREAFAALPDPLPAGPYPVAMEPERPAPIPRTTAPSGTWMPLCGGVHLLLPGPFEGGAGRLDDLMRSAAPLLRELRRQGLVD